MHKIVIVGAGQAGAAAALKLRELGFEGSVHLFGDEGHAPYERPELSKAYALGLMTFDQLVILPPDAAAKQDIALHLDLAVRRIDRAAGRIETAGGAFSYDALILCTGGRARRLPLPAAFAGRALAIRTKADADSLRATIQQAATVAVIGGGWLGTEVAMTSRGLGASVDLIEMAPRLCARVAPEWLSQRLEQLQRDAGVRVHLNARPSFGEDGTITIADRQLRPDLLIEAIGMEANDDLARAAGLACADGILVDEAGCTADPAIYAIGDCARRAGPDGRRMESWQNANLSAERAVRALLGLPPPAAEAEWFWTTQGKSKIQMLGHCADGLVQIDRTGARGGQSRVFLDAADRLAGCIAIDNPREIADARRVMATGPMLDPLRVSDSSVSLLQGVIDHREAIRSTR